MIEKYSTPYRPHPSKAKVIEDSARTANASYSYTGTVRTVGSGKTYATLTAAYAAAASGDIIEVYGTIITNSESGGYWLLNTAKNVLVRGSTSNPADTIIEQNSAATYCIRVRINSGVVFQNLTIKTNQNASCVFVDGDEANRNIIFDNCIFQQNGSGTSSKFINITNALTSTTTRWFEYKNCQFNKTSGDISPGFTVTDNSSNSTHLYTGCRFNTSTDPAFRCVDTMIGRLAIYDCSFLQNANYTICLFGQDTALPTSTIGVLDVRGNVLRSAAGFVSDGFLVGRGTNVCYFYNNEVYINPIFAAASCSLCIKTTSTNVGDSVFKGNFLYAPRPLYIKGGSKTTISNNIFVSNYDSGAVWEAFGFTNYKNGADEVLSRSNVVTYNTFVATHYGIHVYNTGAAEDDVTSFKTCTVNYNKYYMNADKYLYNFVSSVGYAWSDKYAFWASQNDLNSTKLNSAVIQNFL